MAQAQQAIDRELAVVDFATAEQLCEEIAAQDHEQRDAAMALVENAEERRLAERNRRVVRVVSEVPEDAQEGRKSAEMIQSLVALALA